jgi:hypothetical protein
VLEVLKKGYMVPLYRPVQDHRQDYYTSRIIAIESYRHSTPPSYIHHHKSTPGSHPLASDEVCACLSQTYQVHQCHHHWELHYREDNKCTHKTISNHYNNLSNLQREEGKLPSSSRGGGHVSEVVPLRSVALARRLSSSALAM